MQLRDQAILLVSYPAAHSSCVLHLLSREHGLVHLFARGFRRISGKVGFQGSGDTLTLGEVVFRPASSETAGDNLGQLLAHEWTEELRLPDSDDLARLARRTLLAQTADSLLGAGQPETAVFELLAEYLHLSVESVGMEVSSDATRLLAHALMRVLSLSGHRPELQRSVLSGQPMPEGPFHALYSFELGGVITTAERADPALNGPFWDLPSGIARVLNRYATTSLAAGLQLKFPRDADQQLLDMAIVLTEAAAERTFKSASLLRRRRSPFMLRTAGVS